MLIINKCEHLCCPVCSGTVPVREDISYNIRPSNYRTLGRQGSKAISKQYGVHPSAGRKIIPERKNIYIVNHPRSEVKKFTPVSDC